MGVTERAVPKENQIVRVRARQYLVTGVKEPTKPDEDTLVTLHCVEDDAQGEPLEVLWEREVDALIPQVSPWETVARRGFDDPRRFSAYLHTLRWNCVTATDPKLFQAPYRAGIEVKAYQLEFGRLCSNDPLCADHPPDDVYGERFLHGAACHGCVLIAETSCERRNEILDRALVVPTIDHEHTAFFDGSIA